MQQDPEAVHDDKPFTFNRYAYANNNPLAYKDPKGNFPDGVEQAIGTISGAITGGIEGYSGGRVINGALIGASAGCLASLVSVGLSEFAAQAAVDASLGAKVAGTAIADGIGNVAGNAVTGHVHSTQDVVSSFAAGMIPGFSSKSVDTVFDNLPNNLINNVVHITISSSYQGAVGVGADTAGKEVARQFNHTVSGVFGKKKEKNSDFGIGHLGNLGLNSNSGTSGNNNDKGGSGSNKDPFGNHDFDQGNWS